MEVVVVKKKVEYTNLARSSYKKQVEETIIVWLVGFAFGSGRG